MKFNKYIKTIIFKNDSGVEMDVRENTTYLHVKLSNHKITEFKGKVLFLDNDKFTLINKEGMSVNISFDDIEQIYYYNPFEEE